MRPLPIRSFPSRRWLYYLILPLSLLLLPCYLIWSNDILSSAVKLPDELLKCIPLPGLDDIQVVLKTGATESLAKVPVHFRTTLQCIPHFVLFSDYEEDISGFHVHDVLRNVNETIKNTTPDFDLYRRLRDSGRQGLTTGDISDTTNTPAGNPDNPGWKLDKWKFLPMINETLYIRDDAKWYVFIEADTYMIWPTLLAWLERMDSRKPYYFGNQMQIEDVVFAHGGSGIVLSHAAMHQLSKFYAPRVKEWDTFTYNHWAGDCVLGKALQEAGVPLRWSWPMLHGFTPGTFDYFSSGYDLVPWCYPPVAYHHMSVEGIQEMWTFERDWFANANKTEESILLHSDVFRGLIQPHLNGTKDNWNNMSPKDSGSKMSASSLEDCEAQCAQNPECLQYSYAAKACLISKVARRGEEKFGVVSGWMPGRINDVVETKGSCEQDDWIIPYP